MWAGHTTNTVCAGPVSALRWVPLSDYAADGKLEICSKAFAVQRDWGIVRWGSGGLYTDPVSAARSSNSFTGCLAYLRHPLVHE
jgi:hypothetical protein